MHASIPRLQYRMDYIYEQFRWKSICATWTKFSLEAVWIAKDAKFCHSNMLTTMALIRPRGYKTVFMLNSAEHEIFSAEKISCSAILSQKEFAIVRNLRFISMKNSMLSWVEHEKSFIFSGPGWFKSSLGAHDTKYVYSCCCSYNDICYVSNLLWYPMTMQ